MQWPIIPLIAFMVPIAVTAQPLKIQDRHPAMVNEPLAARAVKTETIHSFEQRWEPVRMLLRHQAMLGLTPVSAPPSATSRPSATTEFRPSATTACKKKRPNNKNCS
jgi:hypothetical protein